MTVIHEIAEIIPAKRVHSTLSWWVRIKCTCGYETRAGIEARARIAWGRHKDMAGGSAGHEDPLPGGG